MEKWKTLVALILLVLSVIFDWNWFWAIFIFIGLIHVIRSKEIHFVESITRNETPKLYWLMVIIWSLLAIYSILSYLNIIV